MCVQSGPFLLLVDTTTPKANEPALDARGLCTTPQNASAALNEAVAAVLAGLPPWIARSVPRAQATLRIAYLVQVAVEAKLPMVRRVFDRLYTDEDAFLYLSDARMLDPARVEAALGVAGAAARRNVRVRAAPHTQFYTWPRVQVVLDGIEDLLAQPWDFLLHISESDYPLHTADWLRANFARQRDYNFMRVTPRCSAFEGGTVTWHQWAMWCSHRIIASCGSASMASFVDGTRFPMEDLELAGMRFGHGPEWVAVTRELAEYALAPGLKPFRQVIAAHLGADELFWQTLVLNIPNFTQAVARQRWFIEWTDPTQHSPDIITEAHLPKLLPAQGRFLFTRKVQSPASDAALDALDRAAATEAPADLDTLPASDWELRRPCP